MIVYIKWYDIVLVVMCVKVDSVFVWVVDVKLLLLKVFEVCFMGFVLIIFLIMMLVLGDVFVVVFMVWKGFMSDDYWVLYLGG